MLRAVVDCVDEVGRDSPLLFYPVFYSPQLQVKLLLDLILLPTCSVRVASRVTDWYSSGVTLHSWRQCTSARVSATVSHRSCVGGEWAMAQARRCTMWTENTGRRWNVTAKLLRRLWPKCSVIRSPCLISWYPRHGWIGTSHDLTCHGICACQSLAIVSIGAAALRVSSTSAGDRRIPPLPRPVEVIIVISQPRLRDTRTVMHH